MQCASLVVTVFLMQCFFSQAAQHCRKPSPGFLLNGCTVREQTKFLWKGCCTKGRAKMMDDWKCGYCNKNKVYRCGYCVPVPAGYEVCGERHSDAKVYCKIDECIKMGIPGHPIRRCDNDGPITTTSRAMSTTIVPTEETLSTGLMIPPSSSDQPTTPPSNGTNTNDTITEPPTTHLKTTGIGVVNQSSNVVTGVIIVIGIILLGVAVYHIWNYLPLVLLMRCLSNSQPHVQYVGGRSPS